MKKQLKKKKIYIINTITIVLSFLLLLITNHISPFGNNLLGKSDAINIFKPMLFDFITKTKDFSLLNYTFNNALGNPYIFYYLYHLAGPLNLIAVFFKSPDSMYLSTIIFKLIIGSIAMTYYTKSKTENNYIIFIATISYMFSSWFLAYYHYLPWLDLFVLFPFFQKGLEDLINKHKYNLYITSLALIIISNFYLAFSICVYTLIYFIISALVYKKSNKKDKIKTTNIFILSTLTTSLLIFFILYLDFDSFIKTGLSFQTGNLTLYKVPFINFIKSLFYGNIDFLLYKEGNTFPNIACNTFILINIFYFFINKKINKKDKIFSLIGILIILFAIFLKPLDFCLNFFHDIRGLTFRYSFIIIFLSIKLFIYNLKNLKENDYKKLLIAIPIIIILLLISLKKMETKILIFNLSFIIIYSLLILLYKKHKFFKSLLCLSILIQSIIGCYFTIISKSPKEILNTNTYIKENVSYRLNKEDNKHEFFNYNLYNNSKTTYFISAMKYNSTFALLDKLGCEVTETTVYCPDNQIVNLLLNIKQDYYLEKIYASNTLIEMTDLGSYSNLKDNLENLVFAMTGIEDIFKTIKLTATEKDDIYYYQTDEKYYLIEKKEEDGSIITLPQTYQNFNIDKEYGQKEINIYVIKEDKLKEIYNYLKNNQIEYTSYNDNHLKGTINVNANQLIFTSIPYDKSWEIKIDDKIVEPIILLDSLIGIEVEPGKHTIEMKYKNTNYIGPSIVSIIAIISYIIFNIKRKN